MEGKISLPAFLLIFIFLSPVSMLCAQDDSSEQKPDYHIDYSEGEAKFFQRLMWDKDEYALYYEIEIQIYSTMYSDCLIETAKDNFIFVSLPPGQYRYSVTTFDLLGRRTETSDWMEFKIIAAHQPGITRIVPDAFYMDQIADRILHIAGANIFEDSVIYLRDDDKYLYPADRIYVNNSRIRLIFDDETLIPGSYSIVIENPGGLIFSYDGFFVGYRKPLDFFIKIILNPSIPVYGEMKEVFGSNLFLPCTGISIETISSKRTFFNYGIEFAASTYFISPLTRFQKDLEDFNYNISNSSNGVAFADIDMNLSFQKRFNNMRNTVTLRFGTGISFFAGYGEHGYGGSDAHINAGISTLFLLYDIFHLEAGVSFSYYIAAPSFLLVKPAIAMVWKK